MGQPIGRIVEVRGLNVKAKLDKLLPPYLVKNGKYENAPKINGFLKTKVGLDTIICQVVGEFSEYRNGKVDSHFLELQVKGYISKNQFIQGLRMLPIVSAEVELLEQLDYKYIYNAGSENTIHVGHDLFDVSKEIDVDINNLIPTHIGVFGNTGSGKSNTLTKLLLEYESKVRSHKTNRGKFIVFDINNEYSIDAICEENKKKVYKLSTRKAKGDKIPLNLKNLSEDNFIVLMNASEKTQVPAIKNAYRWTFIDEEDRREKRFYLERVKSMLLNGKRHLFFSLRHNLDGYFKYIDNFKFNSTTSDFYYRDEYGNIIYVNHVKEFEEKLNQIDLDLPEDSLDRFIFELYFAVAHENENGVQLDFMMPLIARANRLIADFKKVFDFSLKDNDKDILFEDKNVCVVQLGDVNKEMKEIIPSLVSNRIFDSLAEKKDDQGEIVQIINIVIDEAHNLLYDEPGQSNSHKNVLEVFERIVKEGRKFGCYLMLASQRPSDISQTIISQLHNYFIHKLVNPSDIAKIRKAVAYLDETTLDFLTILAPGECIVSGTAFQMPNFVYVQQVEKLNRPQSENVKLFNVNGEGLFQKGKLVESK
ncbi:ATP-binding protein [Liberiplasma polymorphum]|uniref:ATP-binding protein n=1 Tax=Liberiplasma polymorphum TaxID=3374570 RepID=UPI003772A231